MVISVICDGAIDGVIDGALDRGAPEGPGWGESFLCNILIESVKVNIFWVQIESVCLDSNIMIDKGACPINAEVWVWILATTYLLLK